MKKKEKKSSHEGKEESSHDLKQQSADKEGIHKGYNEKNLPQPQGAFKPDSKTGKK